MSFDSVSEESNVAESSANGRSYPKETDMCISPESTSTGRTSTNKNYAKEKWSPKRKSKKKKRDRPISPFKRGRSRSRSRERSRRDRESRSGRDSSYRRDSERRSSRKFSRRDRSRSRTPQQSSSSRRRGDRGSRKRSGRRRSTSSSSSDENRSIRELQQGGTLSSLLTSHKPKKKKKNSSSSSSSSEDTPVPKSHESKPSLVQMPQYIDPTTLNLYYQMVVPMAQPPPSHIPIPIPVPPFIGVPPPVPPPVPPTMHPLPNTSMPPPPLPSIPPIPPMAPPLPPPPAVSHPVSVTETPVVTSTPSTSQSFTKQTLPLPNIRRNYDQPVVLNKERRDVDVSNDWGSGFVEKYEIVEIVGEGTYGQVYKANEKTTGDQVALKKVRLENEKEGFPITAVREIKILRQLNHPNVVKLIDIVTDKQTASDLRSDKVNFYLVFEYVDHDLTGILEAASNNLIPSFTAEQVAGMFKQLLQGLNYCHGANFLHRDIKCSNILVNNRGELKIADFGLARLYQEDQERLYTNRVITLWYRPPELLLGEEHYGPQVDVWSVGCILAEFFIKKALFMANSEMKQLDVVSRLCGSPTPETWPDVEKLPLYHTFRPKRIYFRTLKEHFDTLMPNGALDLMDKLLTMDPKRRPSASDALKHYWVKHVDPSRIPPPTLPSVDCHEMWSKRQKKKKDGVNGGSTQAQPVKTNSSQDQPESRVSSDVKQEPSLETDANSVVKEAINRYLRDPSDSSHLRAALQNISESAASDVLDQLRPTIGSAQQLAATGHSAKEQILAFLDVQLGSSMVGARPSTIGGTAEETSSQTVGFTSSSYNGISTSYQYPPQR